MFRQKELDMKNSKKIIATIAAILMGVTVAVSPASGLTSEAAGQCPYFDFSEQAVTVEPGGTHRSYLEAYADYTYYITGGSTSAGTYLECSFKSGAQYVTYHVGADETAKYLTFWFYGCDENVGGMAHDMFDSVNVTVKGNAAPVSKAAPAASASVQTAIAGGKTGSLGLTNGNKVAMLYNQDKVAMASFSVSDGTGNMPELSLGQTVAKDGKNYFTVSSKKGNTVKLSDSDKAVFAAQGYAGVCLNGAYINWP